MSLRAIIKGFTGELKTRIAQGLLLDPKKYCVINNLLIPDKNGSTQIDHVIVSRYGIFVVETKNKGHWIFGDPDAGEWTQVIFNNKYHFQNPLHQNYRHTKSLAAFLELDHSLFHSIVVFWGGTQFKTRMPKNVANNFFSYVAYVKSKKEILIDYENTLTVIKKLKTLKADTRFIDHLNHVNRLKRSKCPICGSLLVQRTAWRGANMGNKFLGCSQFPRCNYTTEIR
jgi:restriction system protein